MTTAQGTRPGTTFSSPFLPHGESYCFKWETFSAHLATGVRSLLSELMGGEEGSNDYDDDDLTDVTLSAEGRFIRAHKLVLRLCSPYFRQLFKDNASYYRTRRGNGCGGNETCIVLNNIRFLDLQNILTFVYKGEVSIETREDIERFFQTGKLLQIIGLSEKESRTSSTNCEGNGHEETEATEDEIIVPQPATKRTKFLRNHPSTKTVNARPTLPSTSLVAIDKSRYSTTRSRTQTSTLSEEGETSVAIYVDPFSDLDEGEGTSSFAVSTSSFPDNAGTSILSNNQEGDMVLMDPSHVDNEEQLVEVGIVKLECEDEGFELVDPININDGIETGDTNYPAVNQNEVANVTTSKRSRKRKRVSVDGVRNLQRSNVWAHFQDVGRECHDDSSPLGPSPWRVVDNRKVSYSKNCHGREIPIIEGFAYSIKNATANTTYYRCNLGRRFNCNAKCIIRQYPGKSKQLLVHGQHSHDPALPKNNLKLKTKK